MNIIRCSTVNLVRVRAEVVQCLIVSNPQIRNSSWQWKKHITYLHREPFFIIFNRLSFWRQICFNKSVSCATERWEVWTSLLRVVFWYHVLTLMVSGLKPAWSSASVNLSGYITSSLKFQINTVSGRSQRLIKVVFNELSLFSRIFRPTTDSAETNGSWRRHYDNTGRKEKWDTEKKWLLQQCKCTMSSSSWMNRCVSLRLQTLFSWHLDLRIHGSSHKHYMGWSCSWSWWKKENFKAFRKKTLLSCVHEFFYTM